MSSLRDISWDQYQAFSLAQKSGVLAKGGGPLHVLLPQQFDRANLDSLGELATSIRFIAKSKEGSLFLSSLLPHKRAMLYFSQPSTRTFLSFLSACQILGLGIGEVRDPSTSSEFKGETHEDSVRTFSSYFDLIIMRSKIGGLAERVAWVLSHSERPIPVVNAGSGSDQHPTQALLDIYTLQRSFKDIGGIDGKTVVFVGDLARGRTVRSLSVLLANYSKVHQIFVAPPEFQIGKDVLDLLTSKGLSWELSSDLDSVIPRADAVYMTRVQDEWDEGAVKKVDISKYCFTVDKLPLLKSSAIIMHPLPRRNEIPTEIDHDPRAKYWRQMRNGMWVRAALISRIFECDHEIEAYAHAKR
jgi:aspartate carbamoyltransferase catalytic subunit